MKILHLTHTHVATDSRIIKEITALSESGFVVSAIGSNNNRSNNVVDLPKSIGVVNLPNISNKLRYVPKWCRHIFTVVELLLRMAPLAVKQRADLIHVHDTVALPVGVLVKKITGAKLIYDAHELESDRNGLGSISKYFIRKFEKLVWSSIDGLIVVSPSIKEWYIRNMGDKPNQIIYNSPVLNFKRSTCNHYLRDLYAIPIDSKIFIYVGILGVGRGLDIIVEAFKQSDIKSHVIFMGYGDKYNYLSELSRQYHNIHVHPAVAHSKVVDVIRSADFGLCMIEKVSLSDYYCLPNKLFEYYFAKTPVLASDFPDISDFVTQNKCGITSAVDFHSLVMSIKILECRKESFEFLNRHKFEWSSQSNSLISFYKEYFEIVEKEV